MPPQADIGAQEMARSCPVVNLEERGEIVSKVSGMTYGIPLIFQYIRVQIAKVQVPSTTVFWKFIVKNYDIGPTAKVQVSDVEWLTFSPR